MTEQIRTQFMQTCTICKREGSNLTLGVEEGEPDDIIYCLNNLTCKGIASRWGKKFQDRLKEWNQSNRKPDD